jgi:hypothetical protein
VLTVNTIPLREGRTDEGRIKSLSVSGLSFHSSLILHPLLRLFVPRMLAATAAKLLEFQALRRRLLILRRHIVATFAVRALKHNIITRHNSPSRTHRNFNKDQMKKLYDYYSTTSETVPAPTVRPPSRIANRNPFSIAIGAINSISIATLSPGITISTPSGRCATPVTSVVRK